MNIQLPEDAIQYAIDVMYNQAINDNLIACTFATAAFTVAALPLMMYRISTIAYYACNTVATILIIIAIWFGNIRMIQIESDPRGYIRTHPTELIQILCGQHFYDNTCSSHILNTYGPRSSTSDCDNQNNQRP